MSLIEQKTYKDGLNDALKAISQLKAPGCLCTMREGCSGDCKLNQSDYIDEIKKLIRKC